jgi:hypothetical protein
VLFAAASATTASDALQGFYAVADWRAESAWATEIAEVVGPDDVPDIDEEAEEVGGKVWAKVSELPCKLGFGKI